MTFDPTDLTENLTPAAFHAALAAKAYVRALLISLRLNDQTLLRHGLMSVPVSQISTVAAALPTVVLQQVLEGLVACLNDSPHLEFLLQWVRSLLVKHGEAVAAGAASSSSGSSGGTTAAVMPVFRSLQQVLNRVHDDLKGAADENLYLLEYVVAAGATKKQQQKAAAKQQEGGVLQM
jgi:periodic tryptophan protein 2